MTDQNGFRSDEEVLEAIRRTQEMMTDPKGLDYDKMVRESCNNFHTELELAYGFARVILDTVHRKDSWWSRLKMERSLKNLEDWVNHLHNCPRCKEAISRAVGAIEYLKIPPRIVTIEDGEKALRYLAEKNNMTVDEFRAWMNKTSEEVIRKMNDKDKTD